MRTLLVSTSQSYLADLYKRPLLRSLSCDSDSEWVQLCQFNFPIYTLERYSIPRVCVCPENKQGLPKVYNAVLKHIRDTKYYDCVIFLHDDVAIQHLNYLQIIEEQFKRGFSVVGLAGTTQAKLRSPALWHLMGDPQTLSGAVAHPCGNSTVGMTAFGPTPQRCLLLDGLFLAINIEQIEKAEVKFDEQFEFHHYDLDFSLSVNQAQLKMTTAPIWVTHNSPGLSSLQDPKFQQSEKLFLSKWTK